MENYKDKSDQRYRLMIEWKDKSDLSESFRSSILFIARCDKGNCRLSCDIVFRNGSWIDLNANCVICSSIPSHFKKLIMSGLVISFVYNRVKCFSFCQGYCERDLSLQWCNNFQPIFLSLSYHGFTLQSMLDHSPKFQYFVALHESHVFSVICFIWSLRVRGRLANVPQNCQLLERISPGRFSLVLMWLLLSVRLRAVCYPQMKIWGLHVRWLRCPLKVTLPAGQSLVNRPLSQAVV